MFLVLTIEAFVDLIHGREARHEHWGLSVGKDCLELVQQVALPAGEVGEVVFD